VLPEDALIGDGTRGRGIVEREDFLFGGVREVEGLVIQGPADAVGDGEGGADGVSG